MTKTTTGNVPADGLDFEAAGWHDPHNKWPRQCEALNAQHRLALSRARQEAYTEVLDWLNGELPLTQQELAASRGDLREWLDSKVSP